MAGILPDGSAFFTYRGSDEASSMMTNYELMDQEPCCRRRSDGFYGMEEMQGESCWGDMHTVEESTADQAIFDDFLRDPRWPSTTTWFASELQNEACSQSSRASSNASSYLAFSSPPDASLETSRIQAIRIERPSSVIRASTTTTLRNPQINSRRFKKPDLEAKRIAKLSKFLETLRKHPTASLENHNRKVFALYDSPQLLYAENQVSMMQVAEILSQTADVSTTKGFIYTLLSWEIFRREEMRLLRENVAGNLAARQVNQQMADFLKRGCKAKDWASDGRRAAEMVFRAMENLSSSASSSALILLGDISSLDCMLKIAHFPILRQHFEASFADFVRSKAAEWEALASQGYGIFDFEDFLRQGGRPINRRDAQAPLLTRDFVTGMNGSNANYSGLDFCFEGMGTNFSSPVFQNYWETPPYWW